MPPSIEPDALRRVGRSGPPGEDLHHRAHRVGTPQRRLRAADDFDAFDLAGADAAEIEPAALA